MLAATISTNSPPGLRHRGRRKPQRRQDEPVRWRLEAGCNRALHVAALAEIRRHVTCKTDWTGTGLHVVEVRVFTGDQCDHNAALNLAALNLAALTASVDTRYGGGTPPASSERCRGNPAVHAECTKQHSARTAVAPPFQESFLGRLIHSDSGYGDGSGV